MTTSPVPAQQRAFLEDTYLFECSTMLLDVVTDGDEAILTPERVIFHPRGGGQPSDRGFVGTVSVSSLVANANGTIGLRCPRDPELLAGATVTTRIDAAARCQHAALHTAGHLVDAIVREQGLHHRRSNHFPGESRVEFDAPAKGVDLNRLRGTVTEKASAAISADLPVRAETRESVRWIVIDGVGEDPCGGTHVSSLGALSDFAVRSIKRKGSVLKVGYDAVHADRMR